MSKNTDIFKIVFDSINPYAMQILKLAFYATMYTNVIKIVRVKKGGAVATGNNPYTGMTTAFFGYLLGKGIPIIIAITDNVCDHIIDTMNQK